MFTRDCCTLHITGNCVTAGVYTCHVQIYIHMVIVLQKKIEYTLTNFFFGLNEELEKNKTFFLNIRIFIFEKVDSLKISQFM